MSNKGHSLSTGLTREGIAKEIHELLELYPQGPGGIRNSKAYKIVGVVVEVMTKALLRGEEVSIDGFGIFRIREQRAIWKAHSFFYGKNREKWVYLGVRKLPAKKYVRFHPSKALKRFIMERNVNA